MPRPGFEGDAVVARCNVAIFDADVLARIHVNTVAVAAGAANGEIFRRRRFRNTWDGSTTCCWCSWQNLQSRTSVQLIGSMMTGRRGICRPPSAGLPEMFPPPDDGNVVRIVGKNQRAMSVNPFPFPADFHNRVVLKLGTAEQIRAFFQPQSCMRFQFDAADEIISGGHDDRAAARSRAGIKRLLKSRRCLSFFPSPVAPKA